VFEQREAAARLIVSLLDEVEAARTAGERGARVDYDAMSAQPFVTCVPALGPLLSGARVEN
jgi:hypothetical protein